MEKKLLTSDEEYFKYCEEHQVGYIDFGGYANYAYIYEDGIECEVCNYSKMLKNWNDAVLEVKFKPTHYPCVMIAIAKSDIDFNDNYFYLRFVYKEDFETKK